jgi:undecaprenyl-diphosphatase
VTSELSSSRSSGTTLDELNALDQAVFDTIADTPTPTLDRWVVRLSDAANYSRLWMGVAAGLAVFGGRRGRRAAATGMLAVGVTSAVTNLGLKPLADRRRPLQSDGDAVADSRRVRRPESTSFPSGHSASAFAFASAAGSVWPTISLPLHAAAAMVGYSRVHTGVHYPSDVAAGALVGGVCGKTVGRLTRSVTTGPLAGGPTP